MPRKDMQERLAYQKQWCLENPEKVALHNRKKHVKRTYGLDWEVWMQMLESVQYRCQVCQKEVQEQPGIPLGQRACPDHCHETGQIRGVLCHTCNKALGMAGDNLEGVQRFINYLKSASMGVLK